MAFRTSDALGTIEKRLVRGTWLSRYSAYFDLLFKVGESVSSNSNELSTFLKGSSVSDEGWSETFQLFQIIVCSVGAANALFSCEERLFFIAYSHW